jgi:D-alanyl-D-alanine carboxypeptidase
MADRRRRRRRLEQKYVVRRTLLLLIPVALIALIVVFLNREPAEEQPGDSPTPARTSDSQGTQDEPDEPDESGETTPTAPPTEPEPEPEPLPVEWNLLLVNSQNEIPDGFEESLELENITGEYRVDRRIIESYTRMSNQAKEDGVDLMICSAYRSVERQTELFDGWMEDFLAGGMSEEEARAATLEYTAAPKTSEHHTGLAVDIVTPDYQNLDEGYAETAAAKWLKENAADYGFILRYPEGKETATQVNFEPWHYRYVGEEAAEIIMRDGLCLEEYFYRNREPSEVTDEEATEEDPDAEPVDEPVDEETEE